MKKILFAFMLIAPVLGSAETPKPNAADYTIAAHVQSSQLVTVCHDDLRGRAACGFKQHLTVVMDGRKLEVNSKDDCFAVLKTGDYKARLLGGPQQAPVDSPGAYETLYARTYEFLFSDGKTRKYTVVGVSE